MALTTDHFNRKNARARAEMQFIMESQPLVRNMQQKLISGGEEPLMSAYLNAMINEIEVAKFYILTFCPHGNS